MKLDIEIEDSLLTEAIVVSGITDTEELIHEALRTLIRGGARKSLLDLRGKIEFAPDYDPKRLR